MARSVEEETKRRILLAKVRTMGWEEFSEFLQTQHPLIRDFLTEYRHDHYEQTDSPWGA